MPRLDVLSLKLSRAQSSRLQSVMRVRTNSHRVPKAGNRLNGAGADRLWVTTTQSFSSTTENCQDLPHNSIAWNSSAINTGLKLAYLRGKSLEYVSFRRRNKV
jgi:hypothetical protein